MQEVQIFENPEFGSVRIVENGQEPWFVGKDVAEILGYAKPLNAISAHVDEEDKKGAPIQGPLGGLQTMTVINESGLYSLVLSSKLPTAKKFKRWVTSEVLPAIRKTGGYLGKTEGMTEQEILARAVQISMKTIEAQKAQISAQSAQLAEQKPKVLFADSVVASHTSILVGELAKLIKQNGVDIGQNRLFQWLRANGYLMQNTNIPTQRAMDMKLFTIKETAITHSDGHTTISKTPKVTGKGQVYFINKFLAWKAVQ